LNPKGPGKLVNITDRTKGLSGLRYVAVNC